MAYEMTITDKGLICIPQPIRDALGIKPGQKALVSQRNIGSLEWLQSCPHDFEIPRINIQLKPAKFD